MTQFPMMSRVLKVPDEKFRDKVHKTMYENLTTMQRETGSIPANADLARSLCSRYETLLGPVEPQRPDEALLLKCDELVQEMNTPAWLMANDRRTGSSGQTVTTGQK